MESDNHASLTLRVAGKVGVWSGEWGVWLEREHSARRSGSMLPPDLLPSGGGALLSPGTKN